LEPCNVLVKAPPTPSELVSLPTRATIRPRRFRSRHCISSKTECGAVLVNLLVITDPPASRLNRPRRTDRRDLRGAGRRAAYPPTFRWPRSRSRFGVFGSEEPPSPPRSRPRVLVRRLQNASFVRSRPRRFRRSLAAVIGRTTRSAANRSEPAAVRHPYRFHGTGLGCDGRSTTRR